MRDAVLAAIGLLIATLLAALVYQNYRRFHRPLLTTPYQAVTLVSGEVFYGRIDHLGSDHPVLRDVFTVRRETDDATGQPRYVLLPRRDDITGADHLVLPATSIVFIEPVQPDSTIGMLIAEASGRRR